MLSKLRRAWYQYQDRKVAKKYEPKVKKTKNKGASNGSFDKKPIIIMASVISVIILLIVGAFIFKGSKKDDEKNNKVSTTTELESELTTEIETTEETESLPVYTEEENQTEKETELDISPDYNVDSDVDNGGSDDDVVIDPPDNNSGGGVVNPKPYKPKKPKRKANNKVPTQYEKNSVLGGSKVRLIKNSLSNSVGGSINKNMRNLAIYLANHNSSSANSALKSLCGYTTLKAGCKKAVVKIPSNSKDDVSNATIKFVNKLSGSYGSHGIGVSARFSGGKYVIVVVIAYKK